MCSAATWIVLMVAALAFGAAPARAQEGEDGRRRGAFEGIGGVRIGWPQKLSAYLGVGMADKRFEGGYTGTALTAEAGLGAGKIGSGWTTSGGIGMTARGQLGVMRTWGDPWVVGPDQTWVGAEAQAGVGYVGLSVGAYVRVPGERGPAPLLTASFVVGN